MKIWCFVPYTNEKNLGKAYNEYCQIVPNDDDWILIKDGDLMFLTPDFFDLLTEHISENPNTGIFTCLTNRIANPVQLYKNNFSQIGDVGYHREIAMSIRNKKTTKLINRVISGMFMCFKKSTWKNVGKFTEDKKFLGVDHDFSRKVLNNKLDIRVMENIYVFHYYRLLEGGVGYMEHLL